MVSGGSVLKDRRSYSCLVHTTAFPRRKKRDNSVHPAQNLLMEQRIERGKRPFYEKRAFSFPSFAPGSRR
jgi:hypothetical protein